MRTYLTLILLTSLVIGCSLPEVTEAKFEREFEHVQADLKALDSFENAGVRWSATSFKGESTQSLIVELLNGTEEDEARMRKIGESAMRIVFDSVENEDEFDIYEVVFIQQSSAGIATKTYKKPFRYEKGEIDENAQ